MSLDPPLSPAPTSMPMGRAYVVVATVVVVLVAVWPAILNGYPIVYDDSNIYIAFRDTLHTAFPPAYSIFIRVTTAVLPLSSVPLLQGMATGYLLTVAFRTFLDCDLLRALLMSTWLLAVTQLSWLASWLTTDWLGGCGILALTTFWFQRGGRHSAPLLATVAFSAAAATSNLLVLALVTTLLIGGQWMSGRDATRWRRAIALVAALVVAGASVLLYNAVVNRKPTIAIGSSARLFSKLVDKGLAQRVLDRRCALQDAESCRMARVIGAFREQQEFLWGSQGEPAVADRDDAWLDRDGRYAKLDWSIVADDFPAFTRAALDDVATLAGKLALSDEGRDLIPHAGPDDDVYRRLADGYPKELAAFQDARQQRGTLQALFPDRIYAGVTLFGYVGCVTALLAGWRGGHRRLTALSVITTAALLCSTLVHGGLSVPIPRYTVKASWLALFVTFVAVATLRPRRATTVTDRSRA